MPPNTPLNSALPLARDQPAWPTPTCLDAESLARLRELDPDGRNQLIERIVMAYSKSLDRLLPELARARGASLQLSVVRHVSHTLKSSSASLGALTLSQRCADIESMARDGQVEGLETELDCMLSEIAQVRQALNALLLSTL
ncbi:Hpt domain-containing protein [Roseateles sp. GG27B]